MKTSSAPLHLKGLTLETVRSLSAERGEPAWVAKLRVRAFEAYDKLAWPGPRDERWKRSDLGSLPWDKMPFIQDGNAAPTAKAPVLSGLASGAADGNEAVQFTLDLAKGWSRRIPQKLENQVQWLSLTEAVQSKAKELEGAWSAAIDRAADNKFLLLTLALGTTGSFLTVASNATIKSPFFLSTWAGEQSGCAFPLHFVFVGDGSEIQFWDELSGPEKAESAEPAFVASFTYLHLAPNARAAVVRLQSWNDDTVHLQFQDIVQERDTKLNAVEVEVGGRLFRNDMRIYLRGQGAENKVLGVSFGDKKQNFENWVNQNHVAPGTTSDIQFRGALKGASKSFFSGLVSITKEAQRSDAYQSSKSLLLSKDARADAIPNLEILADDVKCSHGAAVGPVDEDQKYYLQTRGIRPEDAEEIIVQGFFEPVIAEVPSDTVREQLRAFVERKLERS